MNEEAVSYRPSTSSDHAIRVNAKDSISNTVRIVKISSARDIVEARQRGRILAHEIGATSTQATLVATVISELARNIILYAGDGEISLRRKDKGAVSGIQIIATDDGPGIESIPKAMMTGFSTSGGLGLGLPGVKRIADSFHITSNPGEGVRVELIMWLVSN